MTLGIAGVLTAMLIAAALFGLRQRRQAPSPDKDMGRVSQSWLMEQRADGQRDRFT